VDLGRLLASLQDAALSGRVPVLSLSLNHRLIAVMPPASSAYIQLNQDSSFLGRLSLQTESGFVGLTFLQSSDAPALSPDALNLPLSNELRTRRVQGLTGFPHTKRHWNDLDGRLSRLAFGWI
jgi:hypothetical protein